MARRRQTKRSRLVNSFHLPANISGTLPPQAPVHIFYCTQLQKVTDGQKCPSELNVQQMCKSGLLLLAWRCQFGGSSCKELWHHALQHCICPFWIFPARPLLGLLKKPTKSSFWNSEASVWQSGVKRKINKSSNQSSRLWGHWNNSGI